MEILRYLKVCWKWILDHLINSEEAVRTLSKKEVKEMHSLYHKCGKEDFQLRENFQWCCSRWFKEIGLMNCSYVQKPLGPSSATICIDLRIQATFEWTSEQISFNFGLSWRVGEECYYSRQDFQRTKHRCIFKRFRISTEMIWESGDIRAVVQAQGPEGRIHKLTFVHNLLTVSDSWLI